MPTINVGNDLNMMHHELQNASLQCLSTNPNGLKRGQLYYCTTDNTLRIWDGTAWQTLAGLTVVTAALDGKVDKVDGKGLSTEDYTTEEKTKLGTIAEGAEVNINADWNATSGDAQILNKPTLGTAAALDAGVAAGNVPVLNSNGQLPDSVIPPLAIGELAGTVNTQALLTTLTGAQQGDIAQVTADPTVTLNGVYWLTGSPTVLSNWVQIVGPGSVISVNGQSGVVTLTYSDVGAVPTTRTVNGQQLSADVTLDAGDVGAVPTTRTVNGKALSTDISLTSTDVGAVPTTRTVNGKALSANITLDAADVGAVAAVAGITAGTYPVITFGDDGLVREGRALTANDIPSLEASKITSGTFALARLPTGNAANLLPVLGGVAQEGQALVWSTSAGAFVPVTLTTGNVNRFEATITGNGTATDFSFAHGLGKAGIVQVQDSSGSAFLVVTTVDDTNVTVSFSTAPTASETYKVIVLG